MLRLLPLLIPLLAGAPGHAASPAHAVADRPALTAADAPYAPVAERPQSRLQTVERASGGAGSPSLSIRRRRTRRAPFVATSPPHAHQRRSIHDQGRFPIHSAPGRAGTHGWRTTAPPPSTQR